MHTLNTAPPLVAAMHEAKVVMLLDDGSCLLDNGRRATRATSCLIEPRAGDCVLLAQALDQHCYVLHILARNTSACAALSVPGADALNICQAKIGIHSVDTLELASARDVSVTAASGVLALNAANLFMTVSESIVQQSRNFIGKTVQYMLDVRQLLRMHAKDTLVTAERDVKMDAERISMG
jgi:hypothetical protein